MTKVTIGWVARFATNKSENERFQLAPSLCRPKMNHGASSAHVQPRMHRYDTMLSFGTASTDSKTTLHSNASSRLARKSMIVGGAKQLESNENTPSTLGNEAAQSCELHISVIGSDGEIELECARIVVKHRNKYRY